MSSAESEHSPRSNPFFEAVLPYVQVYENSDSESRLITPEPELILAMTLTAIKAGHLAFTPGYQISQEDIERAARGQKDILNTGDSNDYELLKAIRKDAKTAPQPLHLVIAAFLAAEHIPPEGYNGMRIPTPSKGRETLDHRIYRMAMEFLRGYAADRHIDKTLREKAFHIAAEVGISDPLGDITQTAAQDMANRFSDDDELATATQLSSMANDVLQMLQVNSAQEINDSIAEVYASLVRRYKIGITMDETGWTILPIEEWETIDKTPSVNDTKPSPSKPSFVDWQRVERLKQYVRGWRGAYLAIANLESQGGQEYYVAVLPAHLGELAIEHALADNPSSGNAIYAWRAEKGIDADEVAMTWRGVFKQTKRIARSLGARRMLHTENVESNILEYLTRPTEALDDVGYEQT